MLIKKFEIFDVREMREKVVSFSEKHGFGPLSKIFLPHREKQKTYIAFIATAAIIAAMSGAGISVFRHPLKQNQYLVAEDSITNLTFKDLLEQNGFIYISTVVFLTATTSSTWVYDNTFNKDNNTVECIGGGGSGGASQRNTTGKALGGGAGAYAEILNFNPAGANVTYICGAGGTAVSGGTAGTAAATSGNNGNSTVWTSTIAFGNGSDNTKCSAQGGTGGPGYTSFGFPVNGGAGGWANSSWGQTKYDGGAGGSLGSATAYSATGGGAPGVIGTGGAGGSTNTSLVSTAGGSANGDSGGTSGTGGGTNNGGDGTYWDATTPYGGGGGGGGNYQVLNQNVTAGSGGLYGAGGGGSYNSRTTNPTGNIQATGGAGRQGIIVLTWTRKRVILGT